MTVNPDKKPLQAFRTGSSVKIVYIPANMDPQAGHYVVLWRDVQRVFEGAASVMNESLLISFMTDDNFEEIPYHPGIVLEVVVAGNSQTDNTTQLAKTTEAAPMEGESKDQDNDLYSQALTEDTMVDLSSTTQDLVTLPVTELYTDDQSLIKYSSGQPDNTTLSLHANNHMYNSCLQTIITGQKTQAIRIKRSMDLHFDKLQQEIDKNTALQEQVIQIQQQIQQLQKKTQEELLEKQTQMEQKQESVLQLQHQLHRQQQNAQESLLRKQDEMLNLQKQTLNRLVHILSRVQALLTQTYELHEYPVPRLFIVLPKATGFRDKVVNLFSDQFRLYFLCECGAHTMSDGNKAVHEVHLAKHEGYDLDKPKEFFEKYGTYILAMMCMVKYGIIAAGLVVPPLANLKLIDGLETAQKHMDYLKKNIAPLVDDTISFLQDTRLSDELGTALATDHTGYDRLEALEGADLRQLESYLKVQDEGRVLGNLFRIVTSEGHVKWVCSDHYRASYGESAIRFLQDLVDVNNGTFIKQTGRITIELVSNVVAKQFYEAMVNARGIQELDISLKWDASMDELRLFASAVTRANVSRLTLNGLYLKGPAFDVVNRGRRFDPIFQLAFNARIQSLRLKDFDNFFSRITKSPLPALKLRSFSLDLGVPLNDKTIKLLNGMIENCPGLAVLELKTSHQYPITKTTMDTLYNIHKFQTLSVDCERFVAVTNFLHGKILHTTVTMKRLSDLNSDDLAFIHRGQFMRIEIESLPLNLDKDRLVALLHSQGVTRLRIRCEKRTAVSATFLHWTEFQGLMRNITPTKSNLESLSIDYGGFTLTANPSKGVSQNMTLTVEHLDLSSEDLKAIRESPHIRLLMEHIQIDDEDQLSMVLRNDAALTHVYIKCHGGRCLTIATASDMSLQDLVNMAKLKTSKTLESISIACQRLFLIAGFSQGRIQDTTMKIERLSDLTPDDLAFIHQIHLSGLLLGSSPQDTDVDRLSGILRINPELHQLQISPKEKRRILNTSILQDFVTATPSTTLGNLESLLIHHGESWTTGDVPQGGVHGIAMTVGKLSDLDPEDIRFIYEGPLTQLAIKIAPEDEGDIQFLKDVLQHNRWLTHLRIGCSKSRLLPTINLIMSTRESVLKKGDSFHLHTFELMEEELTPFDIFGDCDDNHTYIQSLITFHKGSSLFDMRSWVRLQNWMQVVDEDPVYEFIRRYGWSIVHFDEDFTKNSSFAAILDDIPSTRNYQLETLRLNTMAFTASGIDRLDNIIKRSRDFKNLGLCVYSEAANFWETSNALLSRHGTKLSGLRLYRGSSLIDNCEENISQIASSFPTRHCFPRLASFELKLESIYDPLQFTSSTVSWIVAMLSGPPCTGLEPTTATPTDIIESWTALKKITLRQVIIRPEEWEAVIKAIDLSELEHLDLGFSNIAQDEFKLLVERILEYSKHDVAKVVPLKTLIIGMTHVTQGANMDGILADLREKIPLLKITEV
ncbi:hypothetical protein BGX34_008222 [Mortierella sp. NVP85]|nr:hypothetical protein BGX34_008222 [Mortierella sp. NVP85]